MRRFAEDGYEGCRIEDVASDLRISKASVFQHFGEKKALFLATYQAAMARLPRYLDAPCEVLERGFFATIQYWLEQREHLVGEHWVPYRVVLIGHYCSGFDLRREIKRFLASNDPYGTAEFVRLGLSTGELRADMDVELIASLIDWLVDRILDSLVADELDPGLFWDGERRHGRAGERIEQFMGVLRRGMGTPRDGGALGS
jgi:AcrR family transcriptional regulator